MAPKKQANIDNSSKKLPMMISQRTISTKRFDSKQSKIDIDDSDKTIEQLITDHCIKLGCEKDIVCYKHLKESSKLKFTQKKGASGTLSSQSPNLDLPAPFSDKTIILETIYDGLERLVEIAFRNMEYIPLELISVLTILVPLQTYLTRLTFDRTNIHLCAFEELKKFLPVSQVNEIIFDSCVFQDDCSCAVLLSSEVGLQYLSVVKCGITDGIVEEIAEKLKYTQPAEQTLGVLNLSFNVITDEGAKHLGECLRSNRHLRHLNLAGNHITDVGAGNIFKSLGEFSLTPQEFYETRKRKYEYLRRKFDIIDAASRKHDNKLKTSSAPVLSFKKEKKVEKTSNLNTGLIEDFDDPFDRRRIIDRVVHSPGNFALCYLNLMYNQLTYLSLPKLVNLLQYQSQNMMPSETGLVKIVIEGNYLPVQCEEYNIINDLMNKNLMRLSGKDVKVKRKSNSKIR